MQLNSLFENVMSSVSIGGDQSVNVISFRYFAGPDATIIVSKNAGRYRIQSSHFEALWLIAAELVDRLQQFYRSSSTDKDPFKCTYQEDLPLQDYFNLIDNHFQVRIA